jgi:hypothetical protein
MFDLKKIIAAFLDPLKVKNPILFAIIGVILLVIQYALTQGNLFGLFQIEGNVATVLQWLNVLIAILVSPRTSAILGGDNVPQLKADLMKATINVESLSQYNEVVQADKSKLSDLHEHLKLQNQALEESYQDMLQAYENLKNAPMPFIAPIRKGHPHKN